MNFESWNEVLYEKREIKVGDNIITRFYAVESTIPEYFKKIEMSDGKIIDTGHMIGSNWYLKNHSRTIGEIKYWRYING